MTRCEPNVGGEVVGRKKWLPHLAACCVMTTNLPTTTHRLRSLHRARHSSCLRRSRSCSLPSALRMLCVHPPLPPHLLPEGAPQAPQHRKPIRPRKWRLALLHGITALPTLMVHSMASGWTALFISVSHPAGLERRSRASRMEKRPRAEHIGQLRNCAVRISANPRRIRPACST